MAREQAAGQNRRDLLKMAGVMTASMMAGAFPWALRAAETGLPRRKVLFFTKSSGYQHSVIKRNKQDELSYAEQILVDLGKQHGYDVTATKDGRYFTPERLAEFDAAVFYTTGDLTIPGLDKQPPMPKDGPETPERVVGSQGVTCGRCGSSSQQMLHQAPRLTIFKCADCGWRYALSK